ADDHRSPAVLVGAAEGVGEEAPLHQPAREVAAEQRVVQGYELGRQQALEVASQAHLEELLAGALEAPLADGERLLAHAADQARELRELGVGGQAAPELALASRRPPASRPEPGAPAPRLLSRLFHPARETCGGGGERVARADRHLPQPLRHLLRTLPQAGPPHARGRRPPPPRTLRPRGLPRLACQLPQGDARP